MKKITIILIVLTSIVILSALDTMIAPKMLYLKISSDGSVPPEGTITFTCNLVGSNVTKLTESSPNCGYFPVNGSGYGVIYADITQLYNGDTDVYYNWQPDDELRFMIVYDNEPQYANFNVFYTLNDGCFETGSSTNNFVPLAVTLSSFTAVYQNGNSVLQWQTASESSNAGWNVYRSQTEMQEDGLKVELPQNHRTISLRIQK
jgi:hypothetical protein